MTLPITGKLLPLCRDWRPEKLYHLHGKGILNAASILPPAVSPAPGQSCKATTQEPQKCLVVSAETLGESRRRGIVGVPRGHLLWSPCASLPKPMAADTLIRNHPRHCSTPSWRPRMIRWGGDLILKSLLPPTSMAPGLGPGGTTPAKWSCFGPTLRCPTFAETHMESVLRRGQKSARAQWSKCSANGLEGHQVHPPGAN